jgi:hypothetical protein
MRADLGAILPMIRNGLYHITVEMLDSIEGGNQGVMVVRDGTLRGGDSFFYAFGTYTAANGKWKGELTNQEHSPTFGARPVWERKSSPSALPEITTMRAPKPTGWRSPANKAFASDRSCGCLFRIEQAQVAPNARRCV